MTPQELKNSILQLAIQGKLVEHRAIEGTAEELYKQIQDEKKLTSQSGKRKKQAPLPKLVVDNLPFDIPESWKWVQLDELVIKDIRRGKSPKYNDNGSNTLVFAQKCNSKYDGIQLSLARCLDESTLSKYPDEENMLDGDIVINSTGGGTMGRVGYYRIEDNPNNKLVFPDSHVTIVRTCTYVDSKYIHMCLKYHQPYMERMGEGSTNQTELKPIVIRQLPIPLPPLEEQKRIVAKIEELLPLIDKYEQAWTKLEELNQKFPDDMQKSILQMAIQGKLVEQRVEEGTAEELYKQIQEEKRKLIEEGKIKKQKALLEITEDEIPFDIPDSWKWVNLGDIVNVLGGKRIPAGRKLTTEDTGYRYIRVSDMKNESVLIDNLQYVPSDIYPSISRYIIKKEDVYITVAGTIGKAGLVPDVVDGANLTENADRLVFSFLDKVWLMKCINSPFIQEQIADATTKVGQPKLAIKRIQELLVPLPPLEEQKRIVAKIEELLPFCERLK